MTGSTDSHLHLFAIGAAPCGTPDLDLDTDPIVRTTRVTGAEVFVPSTSGSICSYDFGDGWEHVQPITETR